ncbi:MAG: hypothetical protein HGA22_14165 [Clostridiales bacterium]|nr:hypothetical protein [Clostridiales bacterium]
MYYVISPTGVKAGRNISMVNRQLAAKIEENEFFSCGADRIAKLTTEDIEFIQDKKRLASIPIQNLYKTDNMSKYILIFVCILQFITLIKAG